MNSRIMASRRGKRQEEERLASCGQPPDYFSWLACLLISTVLIVWITLASGGFSGRVAALLIALPWIVLRAGGIVTTLLRLPSFFTFDYIVGVAVISTAVFCWKLLAPLSLWLLLVGLIATVAVVPALLQRRQPQRVSGLELLAVVVSLVAATGWSQDLLSPTRAMEGTVVFKPWSDFFFHATILARNLTSQTLLEVGNYEWKGLPAIVYHYASYSLPVLVAKVGKVDCYATAVGFWVPFGSFLVGLSAYALGRVVWSEGAGLAALAGAVLIPDLYLAGLAHPFYGYFWLQHIEPAGLYGVAMAGAALALTVRGIREGRRSWIVAGTVLGVLVTLFKVHIFAASFPIIFSLAVLGWPPRRLRQWLWLGLCVALAVTTVQVANYLRIGPEVHFDFSGGSWYWRVLAGMAKETPLEGLYRVFQARDAFPQHLPQAVGLLLLNSLGIFAILAPVIWLTALLRRRGELADGLSLAAVFILLLMTFGLSRNSMLALPEELLHRPFVWAYWLVASLTAGRLYSLLSAERSRLPVWLALLLILTFVPLSYGRGLQRGKWRTAASHYDIRVDLGLVESAHFIRNQPPADALVQDSHLEEWYPMLDGLSERGSFAGRPKFWARISQAFRESNYRAQLAHLRELDSAEDVSSLQRGVKETGIRWYVVRPGDTRPWPTECRNYPVFESHGYKVYDMQRSFDLQG
ncbi:MAG: hypothetical protein ABJB49_07700 [Nitrospirota bacterium]